MKNFIFALCGFLMMTFVSLNAQASVSEPIQSKSDVSMIDVGMPVIQDDVVKTVPIDFLVVAAPQTVLMVGESPAMQSKPVAVPKCPFRYVYRSKYCTHYSYTAYSKLFTPY